MMVATFDTLKARDTMTKAGIDEKHAAAIVDAMRNASPTEAVTKGDIDQFATKAELYKAMLLQTAVTVGLTVTLIKLIG